MSDTAETEMITISLAEYARLQDAQFKLECLESGGVDNWDWYYDSLKDGGYLDKDDE